MIMSFSQIYDECILRGLSRKYSLLKVTIALKKESKLTSRFSYTERTKISKKIKKLFNGYQ